MLKGIEYVLLGLGLMISTIGNAQQFTEGVFEYGFISYEITNDSANMDLINPFIKQMEGSPKVTIYFTPNRLSLTTKDLIDQNLRGVIDLDTYQEYNFSDISGIKAFIIDEGIPDYSKPIPINEEYGEGKKLKEKTFGLACTEFTTTNDGSTVTLLTTKDITFPDSTMLNSMQTDQGFIVRMTVSDPTIGLSYSNGLKSFSPIIADRNVISIDTTGMNNMTAIKDEFFKALEEKKE